MDGVARSRLLVPLLPRISARSFSAASPASEPAAAAAAVAASDAAAATDYSSSAGDPSSAPPPPARKPLGLLKGGVLAVVAAAFGATGYVSYGAISDP